MKRNLEREGGNRAEKMDSREWEAVTGLVKQERLEELLGSRRNGAVAVRSV